MPLQSSIDPTSPDFTRNAEAMGALVADLREKLVQVSEGGGEASRKRHLSRGKMLARQRVDLLLDPGTAFLELSPLAAHGLYGGGVHSPRIIYRIGRISRGGLGVFAHHPPPQGGPH